MGALPSSTQYVEFEVRDINGDLTTPDSVSIAVKDPSRSTRVAYDLTKLVLISLGLYRYMFDIPGDVIEGDWHVNVRVTLPDGVGVQNVHFSVTEV